MPHNDRDTYRVVHDFVVNEQLLLTEQQTQRLAAIAVIAWNTARPLSVTEQHAFLYPDDTRAGKYRQSMLVNSRGQLRDYPSARLVPALMARFFWVPYQTLLAGQRQIKTEMEEEAAWQVAAVLRAIHPFEEGNRILAWVIENRLRQCFGLPVLPQLRPKPHFDRFRDEYFLPRVEKLTR